MTHDDHQGDGGDDDDGADHHRQDDEHRHVLCKTQTPTDVSKRTLAKVQKYP